MARLTFTSISAFTLASVGATLLFAGAANAQSATVPNRSNAVIQSKCMHDVVEAVPGSREDTGIAESRTMLYQSCVANGGTIPGRR
ncbi:hypothetical protein [Phreatobacter stygius]|uniref:Uncharacterized protein n=1 Tax=Phreatobacter stygius TaxID=1940610 RepID=A0A4D7BKI3_9HYPH|nr:hypothetical protein [Phreatobacter stygius]QCI68257.1 hypothetical protein E8M01_30950 [Phreatobacter stygius]